MKKDPRFFAGLAGVGLVLTYLVWTGITETMVYYLTPTELMARVEADPALHEVGFKVSGEVVPGSHESARSELHHRFVVVDTEHRDVELPVEFRHPLPDTFSDDADTEVVMEGRFRSDGVFEATEVLTKCGSRYEAVPEAGDYGVDGEEGGGYGAGGTGGYGGDEADGYEPDEAGGYGPGGDEGDREDRGPDGSGDRDDGSNGYDA